MTELAVVVIGRNEGDRLAACLASLSDCTVPVTYVDSASTDGSVDRARMWAVDVVELDSSVPLSAARARNKGVQHVQVDSPSIRFVQFVDGDCELVPEWLSRALDTMKEDERVAVVCGRLREKHPERSIFNRLCDLEWRRPADGTPMFGGNAMIRVAAFSDVGGFDDRLAAGEEPDLCVRLREHGWTTARLAEDMAVHDASMMHFSQWWKRMDRGGYAFAESSARRRGERHAYGKRQSTSIWMWGLVMPVLAIGPAWWTSGLSLFLLCAYPLLFGRTTARTWRSGFRMPDAMLYAVFCLLAKWPQLAGQIRYAVRWWSCKAQHLYVPATDLVTQRRSGSSDTRHRDCESMVDP